MRAARFAFESVPRRLATLLLEASDRRSGLLRFPLNQSELASLVGPMWEPVEKARSVLVDHAQRGRYHDWLRNKLPELRTVWAIDPPAASAAAEAFARGQRSLGEGDAHKAMKDLAFACRHHPGHPEYEANLAWARFALGRCDGVLDLLDRSEEIQGDRKEIDRLRRQVAKACGD